jgi:phosphatidylglycerol lysyltransferase
MTNVPRARELVLKYGWNATSYQLVNRGIEHWFAARGDAVVGFVRKHGVYVVAGAPVCPLGRLEAVIAEWENYARRRHHRVCYFGAAGRIYSLLRARRGYSTVVLGAQPVWEPSCWPQIIEKHSSLRAQLNRARNKGVAVSEWPAEQASGHPQLKHCLRQWLRTRGLPSLHFLVEPQTLSNLQGRRIFVAERAGTVVGFLNAAPVPRRQGWLTEQFVRGHGAPNGTVELLLDAMMRAVAADGAQYVTMGLVPLSEHNTLPPDYNPPWLRWLIAWVRAHGRRFYNFDGLDAFKSKFRPQSWEPIYAISSEPRFSPRSLYAIAAAFSGQSPFWAVTRGLLKAGVQEYQWFLSSRSSH